MRRVVCPLVFASDAGVLMFRHPSAGVQLVKGGVRDGEDMIAAARRELYEESGLKAGQAHVIAASIIGSEHWTLVHCSVPAAPETWSWQTLDDHGHVFRFFWHPLAATLPVDCAGVFHQAMALVVDYVRGRDADA